MKRVRFHRLSRSIVIAAVLSLVGAGLLGGLVLAQGERDDAAVTIAASRLTGYYQQRPLTEAGCCAAFKWAPDGERVWFLDSRDGVSGWWSVDAETADPRFESAEMGYESPGGRYLSLAEGTLGDVRVLDRETGESRLLRNVGGAIRYSPDESRIVFSIRQAGFGPPWTRSTTIYAADADGQNRVALGETAGSVVAWLPDGESLLMSVRRSQDGDRGLWQMDAGDGSLRQLLAADHLRNIRLSPDGKRVAYVRAPEPNPDLAGLWTLDMATLATTRMALSGSYAWHPSGDALIVVPARDSGDETHGLWWVDVGGGPAIALTNPEPAPLRISNLEWTLAPDGRAIAYRGAEFLGLWVMNFGPALDAVIVPAPSTVLSQVR